jgi:hypothetical protein
MVAKHRESFEAELGRAVEISQNERTQYIMQVESILSYDHLTDLSQLKEIVGEADCVTSKHAGPTLPQSSRREGGRSPRAKAKAQQELLSTNDQLLIELKRTNELYLDVRVENSKLKDQL